MVKIKNINHQSFFEETFLANIFLKQFFQLIYQMVGPPKPPIWPNFFRKSYATGCIVI